MTSLLFALCLQFSEKPVVAIGELTQEQTRVVQSDGVASDELAKLELFRLESETVVVFVSSKVLDFRHLENLEKGLRECASAKAEKGFLQVDANSRNSASQMINDLFPSYSKPETDGLAVIPTVVLRIEISGKQYEVDTRKKNGYQAWPSWKPSDKNATITYQRSAATLNVPTSLHLSILKGKVDSQTYADAVRLFSDEAKERIARYQSSFQACFLSAFESDRAHFGDLATSDINLQTMSDSMAEAFALSLQSHDEFRDMDIGSVKEMIRSGKVMDSKRRLFTGFQFVDEKTGNRNVVFRVLHFPALQRS